MVLSSQRTMYAVDLTLKLQTQQTYNTLPNTTLNEKFSKLAAFKTNGNYPVIEYYAIGIGGLPTAVGTNTVMVADHSPMDAALFKHIPFVVVPKTADLDPITQSNYGMKISQTFNNVDYYCYYLKRIPSINMNNNFYNVSTVNNVSTLTLLSTATGTLLNPIATDRTLNANDFNTVNYCAKTAKLEFTLLNSEITDLTNAMTIMYGQTFPISEVGIVSGIDVTYTNADSCNGKEVTCAQLMYHVSVDLDLSMYLESSTSILRSIDIGGMEMYNNKTS